MDAEKEVGKKIETLRIAAGFGQRELSDKLKASGINWSQGTLSKVENGSRPIRFTEAVKVAEVLNVATAELQPTGGVVEFLHQKSVWGLGIARTALDDAHYDFTNAASRVNALRLVRELLTGTSRPFTVSGTGRQLIDAATNGIDRDEPVSLLDGLELLRMLGVSPDAIDRRREVLLGELKQFTADRAKTVEQASFIEAARSPEDQDFWLNEVLLDRYAEELLTEVFASLKFDGIATRQIRVSGIEDAHEWAPGDMRLL